MNAVSGNTFTLPFAVQGTGSSDIFAISADGTSIVAGEFAVTENIRFDTYGSGLNSSYRQTSAGWTFYGEVSGGDTDITVIATDTGLFTHHFDAVIDGNLFLAGELNVVDAATFENFTFFNSLAGFNAGIQVDVGDITISSGGLTASGGITCDSLSVINSLEVGTAGLLVNSIQVVGPQGAAVADAAGGATVDTEARTAINTLLARLRTHGLIST